jgi:hypothetical protein
MLSPAHGRILFFFYSYPAKAFYTLQTQRRGYAEALALGKTYLRL